MFLSKNLESKSGLSPRQRITNFDLTKSMCEILLTIVTYFGYLSNIMEVGTGAVSTKYLNLKWL